MSLLKLIFVVDDLDMPNVYRPYVIWMFYIYTLIYFCMF